MVRKVITNLDSSKASGPDCNPVVVLDCEPEFSPALAERFNNCLKESRFLIVRRSHLLSLYLRMLGKGLQLKATIKPAQMTTSIR